jgi:hypothetical protein
LAASETPQLLWTWHSDLLIRSDVVDLLHREQLSGWQVRPAQVEGPGLSPTAAEYWEFVTTGWGGVAPPGSGIRLVERCVHCGLERYSCFSNAMALIDEARWDGSDVFMIWPLPRFVFVTDRVARLVRDNELNGGRLIRLADLTCEGTSISPGQLEWFLPFAQARALLSAGLGLTTEA